MKYRHKSVQSHPHADTAQLPNEFTEYGRRTEGGVTYVGLIQTGQTSPLPTWWPLAQFEETFEAIPE